MDLGVTGKVYLVAAASKGLGYGVAQALAKDGAKVSICSRTEADVIAAGERLQTETGADVLATACDVRDPAALQHWVERTVAAWGAVDGLLVNAGGPPPGAFVELDDAQWQAAFELTLFSCVRLIRLVLPHMNPGGAILTVTSSSVQEPLERMALSNVMRAGVANLVKTLANELAPQNIRINNLIPGRIDTERVAQLDASAAERLGLSVEAVRQRSEAAIPLQRLGTIEEFGAAGAFLLSPVAGYITGTNLRVDGGKSLSL
jgi:3-oxoacyl-[acyl-carrier protein] reductase